MPDDLNQPPTGITQAPTEPPAEVPEAPLTPQPEIPPQPPPPPLPTEPIIPPLPSGPSGPPGQRPTPPPPEEPPFVISPPPQKPRVRIILSSIAILFILASIPAAVFLVKQRQEIRKEATGGNQCGGCSGSCSLEGQFCEACTGNEDECGVYKCEGGNWVSKYPQKPCGCCKKQPTPSPTVPPSGAKCTDAGGVCVEGCKPGYGKAIPQGGWSDCSTSQTCCDPTGVTKQSCTSVGGVCVASSNCKPGSGKATPQDGWTDCNQTCCDPAGVITPTSQKCSDVGGVCVESSNCKPGYGFARPSQGWSDCSKVCCKSDGVIDTTPTPTQPPGCGGTNSPCQIDNDCCSKVCHYAKCAASCGGFDEPTCHTHANCHWEAGVCKNGSTPQPGPGNCQIKCNAGRSGVSVEQTGGDCNNAVVTATWFASTCPGNSGYCSGATKTETGGLTFTRGITDAGCGSWQTDITASTNKGGSCRNSNHGTDTCGAPTGPSASCEFCGVYNSSWTQITDFSTLAVGQSIYFATHGKTTDPQGITKARFRINGAAWQETTDKHGDEFYIQYTIPNSGSYSLESEVYNPTLGWK